MRFRSKDADHYFFKCPLYTDQRCTLFINTRTYHPLSAYKLLFGINSLSDEENNMLFHYVQIFIKRSRRFQNV